jgi:hypothetical protein
MWLNSSEQLSFNPIPNIHEIILKDEHIIDQEIKDVGPLVLAVKIDIWK